MTITDWPDELGPRGELEVLSFENNAAELSDLFVAHHRRLVGLASLLVDDRAAAEEVVQEAFLVLHRKWRHLRDPSAAVAYLNTCVVNGSRRRLRQGRRLTVATSWLAKSREDADSAEVLVIDQEEVGTLRREIGTLPRRQREVLVLRYYLDMSEAEIADTLGISRGSVKSHASRALSTLAARLEVAP